MCLGGNWPFIIGETHPECNVLFTTKRVVVIEEDIQQFEELLNKYSSMDKG